MVTDNHWMIFSYTWSLFPGFSSCLTTCCWLGFSLDNPLNHSWSWPRLAALPRFCLISHVWPRLVSRSCFCYQLLTFASPGFVSWPCFCYQLPTCVWTWLGSCPLILFLLTNRVWPWLSFQTTSSHLPAPGPGYPASRSTFWLIPCTTTLQG